MTDNEQSIGKTMTLIRSMLEANSSWQFTLFYGFHVGWSCSVYWFKGGAEREPVFYTSTGGTPLKEVLESCYTAMINYDPYKDW